MTVDDAKKLLHKKHREQAQCFLLEGEHLALELFKAAALFPYLLASHFFITEKYRDFMAQYAHLGMKVTEIGERTMQHMSDTKTPQGIIAVVPYPPKTQVVQIPKRAIYLHEIQDPGNLGTILRTLAWFGGFKCLLSPNSVDPFSPKVVRSSMGAIFHVPIEHNVVFDTLSRSLRVAYLDMQGSSIKAPEFQDFDLYVFGNEARGVPLTLLQQRDAEPFTIKGTGIVESLNLAQAVGMSLLQLSP